MGSRGGATLRSLPAAGRAIVVRREYVTFAAALLRGCAVAASAARGATIGCVVAYDPSTALVIVDVQNDFASPDGSLYVAGGEEIIGRLNEEIRDAIEAGALVAYTQDWHPPSTPHFEKDGGLWPVHCVRDTPGAQLHPDLVLAGPVVRKGSGGEDGYSGFSVRDPATGHERPTELDAVLRERGIQRLVVAGLATDYCVRETAVDGRRLGYSTTVLTEATRAVELTAGDGERALAAMREAGVELE